MTIQLGLSFLAGLLTTLSPCVLPVLPFLLGSAVRKNQKAPLFMIMGLMLSFIVVGFILSRFGSFLGLDSDQIRIFSASLLILASLFFVSKRLQSLMSDKLVGFSNLGTSLTNKLKLDESSDIGSLVIGALLGVLWSPCVGPTLGAAVSLASQANQSMQALTTMVVYSVGAAIPMLGIAYGLRSLILRHQKSIMAVSEKSKSFFGLLMLGVGISILFGYDKLLEAYLLELMPQAWVDLITKF